MEATPAAGEHSLAQSFRRVFGMVASWGGVYSKLLLIFLLDKQNKDNFQNAPRDTLFSVFISLFLYM